MLLGFKLILADNFISRLGLMAVHPVCQQYFISQVSPSVIANTNLISIVLAFIVNCFIQKEHYKNLLKKCFYIVSISDFLSLCFINFNSLNNPVFRFYAFAFAEQITTCIYFLLISDMINYSFEKHELTAFEAKETQAGLLGAFIGTIFATLYTVPLEIALITQIIFIGVGSFCGTLGWYLIHNPK